MNPLKSALRFPQHFPPPPPPPAEQYPVLTSRFSAETLVIKSPPRVKRMFSTKDSSPPSSPGHRRSSHGLYKPGHSATASTSRIDISSPRAYDFGETAGRSSLDDEGFSHRRSWRSPTPTRTRSRSRGRTTSGSAADKLADAAHEVIAKITLRRHVRRPSGHSEYSTESLVSPRKSTDSHRRSRTSRSLSSPSPIPAALLSSAQRPTRPPPPPPLPAGTPFKLTDLPPRSDSRDPFLPLAKPSSRRAPPPPALPLGQPTSSKAPLHRLVAARPRPQHLPPAVARPQSPPSPSVAPLRPARPPPLASNPEKRSGNSFSALAVKRPTDAAMLVHPRNELFVKIDVGGESTYTTTVATLLRDDEAGGRLAEFVEDVLTGAGGAEVDAIEEEAASLSMSKPTLQLPFPLSLPLLDVEEDGSSSISINNSQFAGSSCPGSPFPFAGEMSSPSGDEHCLGEGDPMSPIDPYVSASSRGTNLFLTLPPSFATPPPALPSPKQAPQPATSAQVVPSPTFAGGGRHKSIHPDVGGVELPPSPPPSLPSLPSSTPPRSSTTHIAARAALVSRVEQAHLSLTSDHSFASSLSFSHDPAVDDDYSSSSDSPLLAPFFDVLRSQAHAPLFPSSPITAAAFSRQSLEYGLLPSDVEGYASEEDRSRSTVLGVPRGLSRSSMDAFEVPEVPQLKVEVAEQESRGRTPSLSRSMSTVEDEESSLYPSTLPPAPITLEDRTLHLFLDRSDAPLSSLHSLPSTLDDQSTSSSSGLTTYSAVFTFLRTGSLPSSLTLPPHLDPIYLSLLHLSSGAPLFSLLAGLRTLEDEARWLGIKGLEAACRIEMERVREVAVLLTGERVERRKERKREKSREEVMKGREQAGWI